MSSTKKKDICEKGFTLNDTLIGNLCRPVWDGYLCWPSTSANTTVHLPCPAEKGLDVSKFATRRCGRDGLWSGRFPNQESVRGWTNFTGCYTEEIRLLMEKLAPSTESDLQMKIQIAKDTRVIEMTGLSISLIFLLISIFVFIYFNSLKNKRTKLHKNLFFAMFAQVSLRLVIYTDQWLSRKSIDDATSKSPHAYSIENAPILCELFYVLMEYARTSVFMWMLLEGIHLHTSIVVVFPRDIKFVYFHCVGWGVPLLLVMFWATIMATKYPSTVCWWGYSLSPYFWILEVPRMCIIAINFVILLNIVCVVLMKVQVNTPSELQQISVVQWTTVFIMLRLRKAVRAALLLLPLLGITNIMDIIPGPLDGTPLQFAMWSYTTHTLSASQGFFISLLYCFLNKEVQEAIRNHWRIYKLSGKLFMTCCFRSDPFPVPRIRPVTEEKDDSRNDAKLCPDSPNSIV